MKKMLVAVFTLFSLGSCNKNEMPYPAHGNEQFSRDDLLRQNGYVPPIPKDSITQAPPAVK